MPAKVFLVTPPFTQLNTPYPATAYLKGFLNSKNIDAAQADLGIETIIRVFSRKGLEELFEHISSKKIELSANARRIITLKDEYLQTIDHVISFYRGSHQHWPTPSAKGNFFLKRHDFPTRNTLNGHSVTWV